MKRLISVIAAVISLCVIICSCGESAQPLSAVFASIKSEVGVSEMTEFSSVDDLDRFYGLKAEDVSDFSGGINKTGVNQEEIVLVKAADNEAAERIETSLNKRYESKLNETRSYNPEQYAIIEKCSVEKDGLYVSLIISENASAMREIYRKAIGKQ